MELTKQEQDLVICAHFELHRRMPELKKEYGKECKNKLKGSKLDKVDNLSRQSVKYYFAGISICRKMYFFLHDLTITRYRNLQNFFDSNYLQPREHKSKNKIAHRENVMMPEDTKSIIDFLKTYASKCAIPLPGRMPQCYNFAKVEKLPSCDTKISVYEKFLDFAQKSELGIRICSKTVFFDIWENYCPNIKITKPASDLCDVCRIHHLNLKKMDELTFDERNAALIAATKHLECAHGQREFYNSFREKAKFAQSNEMVVLSFDYAQNVSYPSSPQQVGSSYFKANRKCGFFGIHDEANGIQTNILIDEEDNAGKGANAVISMLDFKLDQINSQKIVLFSDNCVGQNENNAVLQYLLWRVMSGKNDNISLHFLLTGHTKFSPDRNFGIIKSKFAKSDVDCLQDCIEVVNKSPFNVAVPSFDPSTNTRNVRWAEWDGYLRQYFKNIPNLTKYHHFYFDREGKIKARLFCDQPEIVLLETDNNMLSKAQVFPLKEIEMKGLSSDRAWYLYEQIRPLCNKDSSKDLVAPKPALPKSKKTVLKNTDAVALKSGLQSKKKVQLRKL